MLYQINGQGPWYLISTPIFQGFKNSGESENEDGFETPVLPSKRQAHGSRKQKPSTKRPSSKKPKQHKKSKRSKKEASMPDLVSSERDDDEEDEDALSEVDFLDQVITFYFLLSHTPPFPFSKLCGYLDKEPMYQLF